jgi:hypothetical protein
MIEERFVQWMVDTVGKIFRTRISFCIGREIYFMKQNIEPFHTEQPGFESMLHNHSI